MAIRAETDITLTRVDDGSAGANGTTFTPSVDASGDISWTNDGGLPNPATQNIMGPSGSSGVSVTSVKTQYYLSTSSSSTTGGSWSDTPQAFVSGEYYWTRDYITYSDGNTSTSTPVYNQGLTLANEYAMSASNAADNASEYAARALGNLSTVQSVAETLTWITQHGTMTLTSDVALDPTHVYFVVDAGGDYTVGGTTYAIVTEPDVADIATYYELTIDESLNNYVGTHLALDSEGLWLLPASSGVNKVLIATGAGTTYMTAGTYIIDDGGNTVAMFGESATIGINDGSQSYLYEDYHSMQLIDKENALILTAKEFDATETYHVGDYVIHNGGYYRCWVTSPPNTWANRESDFNRVYPTAYLYVSDLRDTNGVATLTVGFTGTGAATSFTLPLSATSVTKVTINGTATTAYTFNSPSNITFTTAPASGAAIEVTYTTTSSDAKAFTYGSRKSGSNIGPYSFTEGTNATASGYVSHAEGDNCEATADYAHAEGTYSKAYGRGSHAEGQGKASGTLAHAEGFSTASGNWSHAEGGNSNASGQYAHVEGSYAFATGQCAHAEGGDAQASGDYSHAEGNGTRASGNYAHAQNFHTKASSGSQTAIGKYNIEDTNNVYALIIGNGAYGAESNALTVDWKGGITFDIPEYQTAGTTDKALYDAIVALGWDSDVIV